MISFKKAKETFERNEIIYLGISRMEYPEWGGWKVINASGIPEDTYYLDLLAENLYLLLALIQQGGKPH